MAAMPQIAAPEILEQQEQSAPLKPDYGQRNENLPEHLQNRLRELLRAMHKADWTARRVEIMRILRRRLLFRSENGEHYWWWNDEQGVYLPLWERPTWLEEESEPTFQHVTNIFQATLLSLGSVLSQNRVPAQFWPQSVDQPEDVATAKKAKKVVDIIHRNNRTSRKADDVTYLLGTDGFVGAHIRYVSDEDRFGTDKEPLLGIGQVEVAPEQSFCPACQMELPAETMWNICPQCGGGTELQEAVTSEGVVSQGEVEIPRGQEEISYWGALHLRRSMWADEQKDFLYIELVTDAHRSAIKADYRHAEKKIDGELGTFGSDDALESLARRILYDGVYRATGQIQSEIGVFRRGWIGPRAFWGIEDEKDRSELLSILPQGAYVAFFGDCYLESKNEKLDDAWETMHGMPGEGQVRETFMSSIVPLQDQLNDLTNLNFETFMYGVPEGFAAKDAIDFEQRRKQGALPGNISPLAVGRNERIGDKLLFTPAVEPSRASIEYRQQLLGPIREFLSGDFPALHGAMPSGDPSGKLVAILRNQAMGRVGRIWRLMQEFYANVDLKAVKCFAKNRTKVERMPILGPSGEWDAEELDPQDLVGNVNAYPEIDQQYPVLQSQVAAVIGDLMQQPWFVPLMADPDNMEYLFQRLGVSDLKQPGEGPRSKAQRTIEQLLREKPIPNPNATPGAELMPSVLPDLVLDNLPIEEQTALEWANSDAGQMARRTSPLGFANVRAWIMALQQLRKMKQFQEAIAAGGVSGRGPAADLGGAQDVSKAEQAEEINGENL